MGIELIYDFAQRLRLWRLRQAGNRAQFQGLSRSRTMGAGGERDNGKVSEVRSAFLPFQNLEAGDFGQNQVQEQ